MPQDFDKVKASQPVQSAQRPQVNASKQGDNDQALMVVAGEKSLGRTKKILDTAKTRGQNLAVREAHAQFLGYAEARVQVEDQLGGLMTDFNDALTDAESEIIPAELETPSFFGLGGKRPEFKFSLPSAQSPLQALPSTSGCNQSA